MDDCPGCHGTGSRSNDSSIVIPRRKKKSSRKMLQIRMQGKDKGNKKEDGASDDFVATLPKTEEEASEKLAEADSIIKPLITQLLQRIRMDRYSPTAGRRKKKM